MTTVLHIDSSARVQGSATRALSAARTDSLQATHVLRRDVAQDPLPFLTEAWVAANFTPEADRTPDQREILALSDTLVAELEAADVIVIGLPVYNFGVPAALKAWIDLVARAGRTFRYTPDGPVGLLTGKRAVVAFASGGTPFGADYDYASRYLTQALGFLGITDVEYVHPVADAA